MYLRVPIVFSLGLDCAYNVELFCKSTKRIFPEFLNTRSLEHGIKSREEEHERTLLPARLIPITRSAGNVNLQSARRRANRGGLLAFIISRFHATINLHLVLKSRSYLLFLLKANIKRVPSAILIATSTHAFEYSLAFDSG